MKTHKLLPGKSAGERTRKPTGNPRVLKAALGSEKNRGGGLPDNALIVIRVTGRENALLVQRRFPSNFGRSGAWH